MEPKDKAFLAELQDVRGGVRLPSLQVRVLN